VDGQKGAQNEDIVGNDEEERGKENSATHEIFWCDSGEDEDHVYGEKCNII
jgi:hypothetical protein